MSIPKLPDRCNSLEQRTLEMIELRVNQRFTYDRVADRYGLTKQRVQKIIGYLGRLPSNPKPYKPTKKERFWARVDIKAADECWEWQGYKHKTGYGKKCWKGNGNQYAHRVAWILTNGEIPEGIDVLHKCDNPPCCNPNHLFLGTQADNNRDRDLKGRNRYGYIGWLTPEEKRKRSKENSAKYYSLHKEEVRAKQNARSALHKFTQSEVSDV